MELGEYAFSLKVSSGTIFLFRIMLPLSCNLLRAEFLVEYRSCLRFYLRP